MFERDAQLLAYFAGSRTFVLLVVEAFVHIMLARVRASVFAVFAFIFLAVVGGPASYARLAAMFAAPALAVPTTAASALGVLFLLLTLLLFALAGVLIHQVSALLVVNKCTLESRELSADRADHVCLFFAGRQCLS